MPDFRVDSIYDLSAIQEEQAKFLAFLAEAKQSLLDLNAQRIDLKGSGVSSFTQASQELNKTISDSNKAIQSVTVTSTEYNKQLSLSSKAAKDAAQAKLLEAKAILEQEKADAVRTKSLIAQEKELDRLIALEEKKNAAAAKAVPIQVIDGGSRDNKDDTDYTKTSGIAFTPESKARQDAYIESILNAEAAQKEYLQSIGTTTKEIKASTAATDISTASSAELEKAKAALTKAQSNQNIELQNYKLQTKVANDLAKEQAFETNNLLSPYQKLNKEYATAAANAKDLAVEYGVDSVEAKTAAAEALALNTQIQAIDKTVGQSQKNVGNYQSAFGKFGKGLSTAYSGLRKIAYIIPGLGIAGLISLIAGPLIEVFKSWFTAITKVSDAQQLLKDNIKNTSDINKAANESIAKQTASLSTLYSIANDVNKSMYDRIAAVKDLQNEFPDYFKNISQENILNGNAKSAYDALTDSLIANAVAKAQLDKITDIGLKRSDVQSQIDDLNDLRKIQIQTIHGNKVLPVQGGGAGGVSVSPIQTPEQQKRDIDIFFDDKIKKLQPKINSFNNQIKKIRDRLNPAALLSGDGGGNSKSDNKTGILAVFDAQIKVLEDYKNNVATTADEIASVNAQIKKLQEERAKYDPTKIKSRQEDQSALLKEYLKKNQEQISLASEQELKTLLDKYKAEYENQENSENDRLAALQAYHDTEKALIEKQAQAKRDALKIQQTTDLDKAVDIKNLKLRNKTIAAITKEGIDELKNINSDAQRAQQQNDLQFSKDTIKIVDDGFKKNEQDLKDHISILKQLDEERFAALQQSSENTTNEKGTALISEAQLDEDRRSAGTRQKIEADLQYNLTKLDKEGQLERLQIEDDHNLGLAAQANFIEDFDTAAKYEAMITANKKKEAELRKGIIDDEYNYEIQKRNALLDRVQQGESATLDVIQSFGDAAFQKQKDDAQKQSDLLDTQTAHEIALENASVDSTQEKADKIAIINARAAAEKAQLDLKQRKADHNKALFDKQIDILKIVGQIAIDIAEGKFFTAALAGAALIKLIATPVPAYKHGRGEGKDEMAIVGDGGTNEYIWRQSGQIEKTPAVNTLTHLMPKDRVFPNKEALMKELIMSNMQLSDYSVNKDGGISRNDIKKMTNEIVGAVSNIKVPPSTQITKEGWRMVNERNAKYDDWVNRVIKN